MTLCVSRKRQNFAVMAPSRPSSPVRCLWPGSPVWGVRGPTRECPSSMTTSLLRSRWETAWPNRNKYTINTSYLLTYLPKESFECCGNRIHLTKLLCRDDTISDHYLYHVSFIVIKECVLLLVLIILSHTWRHALWGKKEESRSSFSKKIFCWLAVSLGNSAKFWAKLHIIHGRQKQRKVELCCFFVCSSITQHHDNWSVVCT